MVDEYNGKPTTSYFELTNAYLTICKKNLIHPEIDPTCNDYPTFHWSYHVASYE